MFCVNCGAKLPEGAKFCLECGTKAGSGKQNQTQQKSPSGGTKIVAACCTNCGAGLQVDAALEAAVCPFCHTPYIVEKAIQNYNITNNYIIQGADADNLIALAETAMKAGKYSEAADYADRALESDPKKIDAWVCKILVAGHDINGDRSSEIASYVESALDYGAGDADEEKIYSAVLDVSRIHLEEAAKLLNSNMETINRQLQERRDKRDIAAMDSGYISSITRITNEGIEYRNLVPNTIVSQNTNLRNRVITLSKVYESYCDALTHRLSVYGGSLSSKAVARKRENLERILGETGNYSAVQNPQDSMGLKVGKLFNSLFK